MSRRRAPSGALVCCRLARVNESGKLVPIVQMGSKPHSVFGELPVVYDLAKDDEQRRVMRVVFGATELSRPIIAPVPVAN